MQHFPPTARQVSLAAAVLCLLSLCAGSALAQSVVATIPLPVTPGNVAVNPATELAYVPLTGVGQIDVISERTHAVVGTLIGPAVPYGDVADVVEDIVEAYLALRARPDELFIDTVKRLGVEPFRERVYATR